MARRTTTRPAGRLLDWQQAAEKLNVKPRMIRRMREDGRLPFVKIGRHLRFRESDVEALVWRGYDDLSVNAWEGWN